MNIPVWKQKKSIGWLLGFSTFGSTPGFLSWDESTGNIVFTDTNGVVVDSLHVNSLIRYNYDADGRFWLVTSTKVHEYTIRHDKITNNKLSGLVDIIDNGMLEGIGSAAVSAKSEDVERFLNFLKTSTSAKYSVAVSSKKQIKISITVLAIIMIIGMSFGIISIIRGNLG